MASGFDSGSPKMSVNSPRHRWKIDLGSGVKGGRLEGDGGVWPV